MAEGMLAGGSSSSSSFPLVDLSTNTLQYSVQIGTLTVEYPAKTQAQRLAGFTVTPTVTFSLAGTEYDLTSIGLSGTPHTLQFALMAPVVDSSKNGQSGTHTLYEWNYDSSYGGWYADTSTETQYLYSNIGYSTSATTITIPGDSSTLTFSRNCANTRVHYSVNQTWYSIKTSNANNGSYAYCTGNQLTYLNLSNVTLSGSIYKGTNGYILAFDPLTTSSTTVPACDSSSLSLTRSSSAISLSNISGYDEQRGTVNAGNAFKFTQTLMLYTT